MRICDPWRRSPHPDVLGYAQRDYGNRVGLWRLFAITHALGIRCIVSLNMAVIQHYPAIFEAMESRGWEYMSHGIYNTGYHWGVPPQEERAAIEESIEIHHCLTSQRLRGLVQPGDQQYTANFRAGGGMRL